jgi:stringent starvation protein B
MGASVDRPPTKREVMQVLLDTAEARVHLDGRKSGLELPPHLAGQIHVILDYAYGFTPPIPDLALDDSGIHATLSFGGIPRKTFVPWEAVFLVADFDGRGALWHEDMPHEVMEKLQLRARTGPELVPVDDSDNPPPEPPADPPPDDPPKKPRPSHLKLVK